MWWRLLKAEKQHVFNSWSRLLNFDSIIILPTEAKTKSISREETLSCVPYFNHGLQHNNWAKKPLFESEEPLMQTENPIPKLNTQHLTCPISWHLTSYESEHSGKLLTVSGSRQHFCHCNKERCKTDIQRFYTYGKQFMRLHLYSGIQIRSISYWSHSHNNTIKIS